MQSSSYGRQREASGAAGGSRSPYHILFVVLPPPRRPTASLITAHANLRLRQPDVAADSRDKSSLYQALSAGDRTLSPDEKTGPGKLN
ncbi:hypothetical protein EYF80_056298 [Liparis tanakae]|uniref:Uncharacterized protein n=1 Tax=Liparis tanakae TaxID=230148 RepID=A0A4Z2EXJ6_9TELE|nr:hypothetical protein EYF80_056298 [Liparis tanakae]